jgi:hypothetical protein
MITWMARRLGAAAPSIRMDLGKGAERALDGVGPLPNVFDAGNLEGLEILIGAIVVVVVIAVVLIPLLLFGVELIIVGLLVAGGIVARSALGRPWIVCATPSANPAGALAWEVKGWQRSGKLIETVAAELAAGLTPSPTKDPERPANPA